MRYLTSREQRVNAFLGFIGRRFRRSWKRAEARYDWWLKIWNARQDRLTKTALKEN